MSEERFSRKNESKLEILGSRGMQEGCVVEVKDLYMPGDRPRRLG